MYVLISSASASKNSMFSHMSTKGKIEEDIKALGFDHTIIVQPGLTAGRRQEK